MENLFTDKHIGLFIKTIETNGTISQLDQVQEECMELALAIRKYKRAIEEIPFAGTEPVEVAKKAMIKEIADNLVMLAQCEIIFNEIDFRDVISEKMDKHEDRLNKKLAANG